MARPREVFFAMIRATKRAAVSLVAGKGIFMVDVRCANSRDALRWIERCRRAECHEALRRSMEGCQSSRNDERRNVAAVPRSMPNAAQFRGCSSGSCPSAERSLFPRQQPAAPAPTPTPSSANSGNGQSVMKQCGAQWQAAKAAWTSAGQTWPQFLKQCRSQLA
jgi:hypothetical protein